MYKRTGRPTGRPKGTGLSPSLVGQTFGQLSVVDEAGRDRWGARLCLCQCVCGATRIVSYTSLKRGHSKSCGCVGLAKLVAMARTHGDSTIGDGRRRVPEYSSWENMISRCHRPTNKDYKHYGGRGIYVCQAWRDSYTAFLAHIGRKPTPKHTVERIDNDRGYEPGNVRWATMKEQHQNKRPSLRRNARVAISAS